MPTNEQAASKALPPHVQLIQMASAHWVSRLLYAAAEMKLADLLAEGPKTAAVVKKARDPMRRGHLD